MSLACKIGFHSWDGCICTECGKTRDVKHIWSKSRCVVCGRKILFRDNLGTILRNADQAFASWQPYQFNNYTGSLIVKFANVNDAKNALKKLSFIHLASDNNELISSEVVEYGYFENNDKYDAVIWGHSFTHRMWEEAKDRLSSAGGSIFSSQEPKMSNSKPKEKISTSKPENVKFVRNEQMGSNRYKIYAVHSKEAAMEFLQKNPVSEPLFYFIVETPVGNFGRDINGVYQES